MEVLTIEQQIKKASQLLKEGLFAQEKIEETKLPKDKTKADLWAEILELRKQLAKSQKKKKKENTPKVVDAVKILLEAPELAQLPIPLLADIIQKVFRLHGYKCNTSDLSVRWYISKHSLEWNIVRRSPPPIRHPDDADDADSTSPPSG